jgi:acetyltransferase
MYGAGQELIVGVRRDPQFGPLVIVGTGGTEVELMRDISTGIAPLTEDRASHMLERTRAGIKLKGWRGTPPGDRQAVINAMLRLSRLAMDFPEIAELEINPLLVFADGAGAIALDVRGVFT